MDLPLIVLRVILVLSTLVSALAIVVAVAALRLARSPTSRTKPGPVPTDLEGLRAEVGRLRTDVHEAVRHLAVVRYDAFGDMGGRLSWSLALLDDSGDGVVLTSIHGRSEARTYAKNVSAWTSDQAISPEEEEAITLAKAS